MNKIGVIGDAGSVLCFKALGFSIYSCSDIREARTVLRKIAKEGYGVIYITENFYKGMVKEIDEYIEMQIPAIIPIPGIEGSMSMGIKNVTRAVERAVGADILSNES